MRVDIIVIFRHKNVDRRCVIYVSGYTDIYVFQRLAYRNNTNNRSYYYYLQTIFFFNFHEIPILYENIGSK